MEDIIEFQKRQIEALRIEKQKLETEVETLKQMLSEKNN